MAVADGGVGVAGDLERFGRAQRVRGLLQQRGRLRAAALAGEVQAQREQCLVAQAVLVGGQQFEAAAQRRLAFVEPPRRRQGAAEVDGRFGVVGPGRNADAQRLDRLGGLVLGEQDSTDAEVALGILRLDRQPIAVGGEGVGEPLLQLQHAPEQEVAARGARVERDEAAEPPLALLEVAALAVDLAKGLIGEDQPVVGLDGAVEQRQRPVALAGLAGEGALDVEPDAAARQGRVEVTAARRRGRVVAARPAAGGGEEQGQR